MYIIKMELGINVYKNKYKKYLEKNKILINKFNNINGGNIDNIYKIPEHFVANEHITKFFSNFINNYNKVLDRKYMIWDVELNDFKIQKGNDIFKYGNVSYNLEFLEMFLISISLNGNKEIGSDNSLNFDDLIFNEQYIYKYDNNFLVKVYQDENGMKIMFLKNNNVYPLQNVLNKKFKWLHKLPDKLKINEFFFKRKV